MFALQRPPNVSLYDHIMLPLDASLGGGGFILSIVILVLYIGKYLPKMLRLNLKIYFQNYLLCSK